MKYPNQISELCLRISQWTNANNSYNKNNFESLSRSTSG